MQNPPPRRRRAGFSAAKSCYRIRPCSVLSARSTYRNIFSQIDGENQGREEEESNTLILSETPGWSFVLALLAAVYAHSALSQLLICRSVQVYFELELLYICFFFHYLVPECVARVESACAHPRDHASLLWCVRNTSSHGRVLFVCVVCSYEDSNGTLYSKKLFVVLIICHLLM